MNLRVLAVGMFFAIAITSGGRAQSGTQETAEQQIAALKQEFGELMLKGDAEKLGVWIDKHTVDQYFCQYADGSIVTRAEDRAGLIGVAKSGASTEVTEQKISTIGDTAIYTGLVHILSKSTTGQTQDIRFRRMEVWVRKDDDWKMAACAGSPVASAHN